MTAEKLNENVPAGSKQCTGAPKICCIAVSVTGPNGSWMGSTA